jgi:hypothetical protein
MIHNAFVIQMLAYSRTLLYLVRYRGETCSPTVQYNTVAGSPIHIRRACSGLAAVYHFGRLCWDPPDPGKTEKYL